MSHTNLVVLNLGLIEPQGFGGLGVRWFWIWRIKKAHFIFPTTKGSMNACMELVGSSSSKNIKNHCTSFS